MPSRGYKIRSYVSGQNKNGGEYKNYHLTVPADIAEQLPDDITFIPRMTDEGLLFAPTSQNSSQLELPDWAKAKKSENGKDK